MNRAERDERSPRVLSSGYARFAGVGIHFAVTILVFAYGGYRLDLWLDSSPWFLLVGVFLGFFGGLVSMVSKIQKVTAAGSRPKRPRPKEEVENGDRS